jgi:hypothetical protein
VKSPENSSGDENKNVVNSNVSAMATTDDLIAVLSGDSVSEQEKQPEQKPERIRIRIKKDYIRSYNDSLKEQEAALINTESSIPPQTVSTSKQQQQDIASEPVEPVSGRVTRGRRGKNQETPRISPIVSEFDSQSSVLGSSSSQNTALSAATTTTTIGSVNQVREDSKVVHSRGSSVVETSDIDTSQQSSVAVAPPSSVSRLGSENNSMMSSQEDVQPVKKGRGRKKAVKEIELKPPEPLVEKPIETKLQQQAPSVNTRTRNTRNNKQAAIAIAAEPMDLNSSSDTLPNDIESSPEKTIISTPAATGRTRNTRNNNNNNSSNNNNNTSSSSQQSSNTDSPENSAPMPRFFSRNRKNNAQSVENSTPSFAPADDINIDDQTNALNLSKKSSTSTVASSTDLNVAGEYKHKKQLVKRPREQEKLQSSTTQMEIDDEQQPPPAKSPYKQSNNINSSVGNNPKADESGPGVKLLISKKKGSIFKSRALDNKDNEDNNKKRLNLYKHKWDEDAEMMDEDNDPNNKPENANAANASNTNTSFFEGEPSGLTRFTRHKKNENVTKESIIDDFEDDPPITGLMCDKNAKNYYQVVRNVKKAHQMQEIGEFQEMDDDVEYLLDALQPSSQVGLRSLSALQLASKCMTPSFRMHIRAHGIVPKFFKALEDSPNDPSLGLCTAMVMFALSQDTLKMDLDRGSLELMLNLLECEGSQKQYPKDIVMNKQHMERKQKVRELCEEIQSQGKSIHLNLDNITAAQLAMESLLSLTSKRAGEWLKEDLRELGGIEHIMKTVCECCNQITEYVQEWSEPLLEKLNKIGRCLRILENVTSNNEENQKYVLHYKSQIFVKTLCKFFKLLNTELTLYPTTEKSAKDSSGVAIRETLLTLLKVMVNLTHPFNERGTLS